MVFWFSAKVQFFWHFTGFWRNLGLVMPELQPGLKKTESDDR
jgi:hypothetical protein